MDLNKSFKDDLSTFRSNLVTDDKTNVVLLSIDESKVEEEQIQKVFQKRRAQQQSNCPLILMFTLCSGLALCAQSSLAMYNKSVVTSVEKQFHISSWVAGLIAGSFNFGNILFTAPVAAVNHLNHRPRIISIGLIVVSIGGLINFLPHLFLPIHLVHQSSPQNHNFSNTTEAYKDASSSTKLFYLLLLGEIIQGAGSSFILPLTSSFIDDHATKTTAPIYIGISLVVQNLGPGIGFLVGSWSSTFYVDFDSVSADQISVTLKDHSDWIGAWWLGFLILSAFVFLTSLPLLCFKRSFQTSSRTSTKSSITAVESLEDQELCHQIQNETLHKKRISISALYYTLKRLLSNYVYISIIISYTGIMFTTSAMTSFMPKHMEVVFNETAQSSNLLFGVSMICVVCCGLLLGAYTMKVFRSSIQSTLIYSTFALFVSLIPLSASVIPNCQSNKTDFNQSLENVKNENNCSSQLTYFLIAICLGAFISSGVVTVLYTSILRLVHPSDKVAAIGFLFLIARGFGMIPAPIISGLVIDQACKTWNYNDEKSNCLEYEASTLRFSYISILWCGVFIAFVFSMLGFCLFYRKNKNNNFKPTT